VPVPDARFGTGSTPQWRAALDGAKPRQEAPQ